MTRVLYLLPAAERGGAEVVIESLLGRLDRRRFEPLVVFLRPGPYAGRLAASGVRVITLTGHRAREPLKAAAAARALRRIVQNAHVDVIHANAGHLLVYAVAAAYRTRARVVWHVHDPLGNRTMHERVFRLLQRPLHPDLTVFANHAVATSYLRAYPGIRRHEIVLPGVDPARFASADPARARRALGLRDDAPLVVTIARLQAFKGHETLLEAAPAMLAAHPGARLAVVGGTPFGRETGFADHLRRRAADLGVDNKVVFTGEIPDQLRDDLLAAAWVYVHPARYEPFGIAVVEAMAAGVPVVAADADGPRRTVADAGILVPAGDATALARAVVALLDDPERRAALGAAGRSRVATQLSLDRMAAALERIYDELVTSPVRHG